MNSPLYAISLLPVWRRQPRDRGPAQCMTATLWSSLMALLKMELVFGEPLSWMMQTGHRDVFWGQVPDELIKGWNRLAGEQVISQIEAYAALLVRWFFRKQWIGRKGIFFQGNDAARYSLIKAASSLASMMLIVQAFHSVDAFLSMMAWIKRVLSASNIADWPSRGLQKKAVDLISGRLCGDMLLASELQESLTKHPLFPLLLLKGA